VYWVWLVFGIMCVRLGFRYWIGCLSFWIKRWDKLDRFWIKAWDLVNWFLALGVSDLRFGFGSLL
jgi:hypothetical protein